MKTFTVERIQALLDELHEFNKLKLSEVELTENGIPIDLNEELLDAWRFVGLSNQKFVDLRFWEQK